LFPDPEGICFYHGKYLACEIMASACLTKEDAFHREKYLKAIYGRRYLENRVKKYFTGWTEGFDRQSKKEFSQFLNYSSASASEVQSHLYVALDQKYIASEEFQETYNQVKKTKSLINGFISYLKGKKKC